MGVVYTTAICVYVFIGAVDPYELRWRHGISLADHPYPVRIVPRLVNVAVNEDVDLVIVGGSAAMGYTPAMLREAFPWSLRPLNLTYACASVDNIKVIAHGASAAGF